MPNCCGWREFYKLVIWKLVAFKRVLLLDLDVQVLQSIDHLFGCPAEVHNMYVAGPSGPWQGGFFMATPSQAVYAEMLQYLKAPQYSPVHFWFKSAHKLPHQFRGNNCYGCEGPQGFLYWFFVLRSHRLNVQELDACIYDAINPYHGCLQFYKRAASPLYTMRAIHKYSTVHLDLNKCRYEAAVVAAQVREIVGPVDARSVFHVTQCKLGESVKSNAAGNAVGKKQPAGVPVEVLCQSMTTCTSHHNR